MRVTVELNTPEVSGPSAAHLVLRDPESDLPVAEIAIRGAGYVVLTEEERTQIGDYLLAGVKALNLPNGSNTIEIPDREGGYHGEPPLWQQVAAEQAAKRGTPSKVVKVSGKKVRLVEKLEDIAYPEGCEFLPLTPEEEAAGQTMGIVVVPSRKLDNSYEGAKRFRRACKRARAQQYAFLAAQKDPNSVEEGDADEDSED